MATATPSDDVFTAVGIDRDKNSQFAVKWAVNGLNIKNGIILVHVKTQQNLRPQELVPKGGRAPNKSELQQLFLSFRGYCARKGVLAKEVILHDLDVAGALADFIKDNSVTTMVVGASNRSVIARAFRNPDVPTSLGKLAPDFCRVYAVTKERVSNVRSASRPPTPSSRLQSPLLPGSPLSHDFRSEGSWQGARSEVSSDDGGSQRISLERSSEFRRLPHWEKAGSKHVSPQHSVISSTNSSPRHSVINGSDLMQMNPQNMHSVSSNYSPVHPSHYKLTEWIRDSSSQNPSTQNSENANDSTLTTPRHRHSSNTSIPCSCYNANLNIHLTSSPSYSMTGSTNPPSFQSSNISYEYLDTAQCSDASRSSDSLQNVGDIEEELKRLRLELKQTMEMINSACIETVTAKKKVREIDKWKSEEAWKLEEARQAHETALAVVHMERQKAKVAAEAAQMAQQLAELESQKRKLAEMRLQSEVEHKKKAMESLVHNDIPYRRYTIEEVESATNYFSSSEKIGEGGYGPVYKGYLDHTFVAIKVLRPDISQGLKQFNREIEVLSCMRHPHLVLLLGACSEYGCLVYEYMQNGSLEDRLFCKNNTPSIPWSIRFKIAAEITTGLLFLHQTKPEPLVHRDLKPANILLDGNYVSKISDVGLSRLVPASIAEDMGQHCITAAAGTFCYIDPEYQQTGILGTKSDIYSLGIILLQLITAKPPMGLPHQVERAIESGSFAEVLDPMVKDWPVEDALSLAKVALSCCQLKKKDRPDLGSVVLPELRRLSNFESENEGSVDFIYQASSYNQSFPGGLASRQVSQM